MWDWVIAAVCVWLLWWLLFRRRRSGGTFGRQRAQLFAEADFGEPGKPLTLAKAKTELRRVVKQAYPGLNREFVACEVENFVYALDGRREQLESIVDEANETIEDAQYALETAEDDLEEARDELIADPHRSDRDAIKAGMARLAAEKQRRADQIKGCREQAADAKAKLADLRKDKRAFLAEYLNVTRNGGSWPDLFEQ